MEPSCAPSSSFSLASKDERSLEKQSSGIGGLRLEERSWAAPIPLLISLRDGVLPRTDMQTQGGLLPSDNTLSKEVWCKTTLGWLPILKSRWTKVLFLGCKERNKE